VKKDDKSPIKGRSAMATKKPTRNGWAIVHAALRLWCAAAGSRTATRFEEYAVFPLSRRSGDYLGVLIVYHVYQISGGCD
jgi:hypothetical protein